jgi:hypothetical protein
MSIIKIIKNTCRGFLGPCLTAFLLLFYILGSVESSSLHSLLHQQTKADLHGSENEDNPCHIRIYEGCEEVCDHPTHISGDTKCSLCDSQFYSTQLVFETAVDLTFYSHSFFVQPADLGASTGATSLEQGRAPPVC